jgi:filamentous hemagglutinin
MPVPEGNDQSTQSPAPAPAGVQVGTLPVAPPRSVDDIIVSAVRGVEDLQRGHPVRSDLDNHLVNVDGPRGAGGHNQDNFIAWVESKGGIYAIQATSVPGINEIYAVLPRTNDPSFTIDLLKTTYDPNVYTDAKMNEMARAAGKQGWEDFKAGKPNVPGRANEFDTTVEGVRFKVYINLDEITGKPLVGNVHPVR